MVVGDNVNGHQLTIQYVCSKYLPKSSIKSSTLSLHTAWTGLNFIG